MKYSSDIVVIDLEATCEARGKFRLDQSNIIEIGAVRLDRRSLEVVDTFSERIKPRHWPITPFITELTGITPESVANCDEFDGVMKRFLDWYGPRNRSILAAYGVYYDIPLFRWECKSFGITYGNHFVGGAMDIRTIALLWLAERGLPTQGITVEKVIDKMGLELDLDFHRALDDAKAAAAILQLYSLGEANV